MPYSSRRESEEEERQWIPMLERGCCCSLEFCCKVQATLIVIASMMYTPLVLVEYFRCQRTERIGGVVVVKPPDCKYDDLAPHPAQARVAEVVIKILLQTISLLAALAFLVGIQRRRPKLLLPYVRVLAVHIIFSAFGLLVKAAVYNMWFEAIIFILPLGVGLPYYMWLCAYSLYRKMKRELGVVPARRPFDGEDPTTVATTTTVRIYAPPPGFVLPQGYGYAPPTASASNASIPIPIHTLVAGMPPPGVFMKPEDVPPPPYEAVVGLKPPPPAPPHPDDPSSHV